ncbi:MAG: flagellar filament capping protein FliD, partial [Lachnospiraceae bacterium]|nr:flagellar filament capping protein FliD [Lachnospiraceae bacterium]
AKAVVDGATMTSATNTLTVNGLTLNLLNTTKNESTGDYDEMTVTVTKDTASTYDLIKNAVNEYNNLLEEMSKLYYADSARDYDPLTDEQKESMSDDEIEQWENKIKGSLLRRDTTLGSLMTSMRTALQSTYTDSDGNTYSLSTYGIVTGTYTERGKLHILGNKDDAIYAADNDRLQAALDEDPDKVMEAMSGIFTNLYSTLSDKCAKTSISSALTFYNDKQYKSDLDRYQSDLDTINDRIDDLKDRYYKQFTAMEKALAELQSKSSSLASMLGTSTTQNS